jgi:putative transposase
VFFEDRDYRDLIGMLSEGRRDAGVDVWAYCLMPNHVHYVVVPTSKGGLARLFASAHRRYALRVNSREGWRGHLWQERFYSVPMDETHLVSAVRYVELNPVRAGLCESPADWPWSSVHAHLNGEDDRLVSVAPMLERVADWKGYLSENDTVVDPGAIRRHTRTGRPLGSDAFVSRLESITGRCLRKGTPGPAPADK